MVHELGVEDTAEADSTNVLTSHLPAHLSPLPLRCHLPLHTFPEARGPLALSSHISLTLPQELLGLVRVEVLGLNQHHQEAVGSREVADGEKDLSTSCRSFLRQKRGYRSGASFRGGLCHTD